MLTKNMSPHGSPMRYAGAQFYSACEHNTNGMYFGPQTAMSQYAGMPVGARHPVSYVMALKDGGIAAHILASASLQANVAGSYAVGATTMSGIGSLSAGGFLTAERTVTMAGVGSMSAAAGGSYANGSVNIRIGFNPTADDIANAVLDTSKVEEGLTVRQALRLIAAALAGKVSGAPGGPVAVRNAVADTKTRITATVDGNGNVSAITYDLTN